MRSTLRLLLFVSALSFGFQTAAQAAVHGVTIFDFGYQPEHLKVRLGTTVVWTNVGEIPHVTISNTQNPPNPDGTIGVGWWDSDYIAPLGGEFRWVFSAAGTFPYHGEIPNMDGSVIVPLRIKTIDPGTRYRVIWATQLPSEPDLAFAVQKRDPGEGELFADWKQTANHLSAVFRPEGPGIYTFRARLVRLEGGTIVGSSMYSPVRSMNASSLAPQTEAAVVQAGRRPSESPDLSTGLTEPMGRA
jgi:plastocyanin